MKKQIMFLVFLLVTNALAVFVNIHPVFSNPSTLLVPSQYPTIQSALAAAISGDTIIVAGGVYNETNLVITQNGLTLQGENRVTTVIDGQNHNTPIINVEAHNVVIRGFTIRNAGTQYGAFGVNVTNSNNAYLADNIFSGCYFPIRAQNSLNLTVTSSVFQGDTGLGSAGVYALRCQTGLINNNTMNGNHVGAFIIYSSSFMIRNNTFSSCILAGVAVSWSEHNWVVRNKFVANIGPASLEMRHNGTNTAIGNTFLNNANGLLLENAPNNTPNTIHHNNFIDNAQQVDFLDASPFQNLWNASLPIAEGNYWSDYSGKDANKDGIGDTLYYIATNNQDQRPLTGPFTEFTAASPTETYNIYTISNSTITDFNYNSTAKQISFRASGTSGSLGVCRVVFPNASVTSPYRVYVNGVNMTTGAISNSSHTVLYFNYLHGSQPSNVVIVPEFPTAVVIALLLLLTLLVTALNKRMRKPQPQHTFILA